MRLVFLGPPGAGKGTQAARVAEKLRVPQISTGDILRDAVRRKADLGLKANAFMEAGQLVPDDLMLALVQERLGEPDCGEGYVLDGYPRTLAQAKALDRMLEARHQKIDAVVFIDVKDEVVVWRLTRRRVCPKCKALYSPDANPPRTGGKCDQCATELVRRADDSEETIRTRLDVYRNETLPLVDYYEAKGVLVRIGGEGSVEDIFAAIMQDLSRVRQA
jgi:adenylate kinase